MVNDRTKRSKSDRKLIKLRVNSLLNKAAELKTKYSMEVMIIVKYTDLKYATYSSGDAAQLYYGSIISKSPEFVPDDMEALTTSCFDSREDSILPKKKRVRSKKPGSANHILTTASTTDTIKSTSALPDEIEEPIEYDVETLDPDDFLNWSA